VAQDLGIRHIAYGVTPEHYGTVGSALLGTLEQGLGEAFTPEVKAAWTEVYTVLATTMKEAAAAQPEPNGSGTISAEQIALVQETFKAVLSIKDAAAELFYNRLFEDDPTLEALFPSDLTEQKQKLMATLATAVGGLGMLDEIVPIVQDLGIRHAAYGVKPEHYDTVAGALLWTLEQGLAGAFTPEVKTAWTEAYMILAETMKEAAAEVADEINADHVAQLTATEPAAPVVDETAPAAEPDPAPDMIAGEDAASIVVDTGTAGRSDQVHAELTALLEELERVGSVAGQIDKIARQTNLQARAKNISAML
jgi:nitric oxide dioxygenase